MHYALRYGRGQRSIQDFLLHCKNIRISTDIFRRVFRILTEPVAFRSASVNRRNNEAGMAMWAPRASLFHRFTDTNVYGTGSVKMRTTRHKQGRSEEFHLGVYKF